MRTGTYNDIDLRFVRRNRTIETQRPVPASVASLSAQAITSPLSNSRSLTGNTHPFDSKMSIKLKTVLLSYTSNHLYLQYTPYEADIDFDPS